MRRTILVAITSLPCAVFSAPVVASPVTIDFTLSATSGNQFGVAAPATINGTFEVDSSFLARPDGDYGSGDVTDFYMKIGTQVYDQNTAASPDIQGERLKNNDITGLAMNFAQTYDGLQGPYTQWSLDGTWEAGSTVDQDSYNILRGVAGSQSFKPALGATPIPEPGTLSLLGLGAAGLASYRRRKASKRPATSVAPGVDRQPA